MSKNRLGYDAGPAAFSGRFGRECDALRLGVFAPLRLDGTGFNAETQRRRDAEEAER